MRTSTYRASAVVVFTPILIAAVMLPAYAQAPPPLTFKMTHRVSITNIGLIAINETINIVNLGMKPTPLPELELKYGSIRAEDFSAYLAKGPVGLDLKMKNVDSDAMLTVSPKTKYQIQPGSAEIVNLTLYLTGLVTALDETSFQADVPLIPSLNYQVKEMRSSILLPTRAKLDEALPEFSVENVAGSEVWKRTLFNASSADMNSKVLKYTADESNPLSILRFPKVERTFIVGVDGSVTVREDIQVENIGGAELSQLPLTLLDKEASEVVVAPTSNPPLINRFKASLTEGKLDLKGVYGIPLQKGGRMSVRLEYPLPEGYSSSKDAVILFKIPMKPPVVGVVEDFTLRVETAPGVTASKAEAVRLNAPPVGEDNYSFEVSLGIAWASSRVMPAATAIFVIILLALTSGRIGLKGFEGEEASVRAADISSIFEEKISSTASILDSLQAKGVTSKADILKDREAFGALRGRVAGRLGELKSKILSVKPGLKELLTELSNSDREYNRAASDLINLYDQYSTGRMRKRTFEDLAKRYRRRLEQAADHLMDIVEQIRAELEK